MMELLDAVVAYWKDKTINPEITLGTSKCCQKEILVLHFCVEQKLRRFVRD